MKYAITADTIQITCTLEEIAQMELSDWALYATPDAEGHATHIYYGQQPQWRDDFRVATEQDFCDAEGWNSTGWQEMTEEEQDAVRGDETTITVSRK